MDELFEDDNSLEGIFNEAAEHLKSLVDTLSKQDLLFFYARFKQATIGQCNTKRPGIFDFQGRQKWDAWSSLGTMGQEDAMQEYVDHMTMIDEAWEESNSSKGGLGVGISTMYRDETSLSEKDKTIFDWCKEGNVDNVQRLLTSPALNINDLDESGLALIHWACDRGWLEVIELLLRLEADVNLADADGQTPLHYAVTCEHTAIVRALLEKGADTGKKDCDGQAPAENTTDREILDLLEKYSNQEKT